MTSRLADAVLSVVTILLPFKSAPAAKAEECLNVALLGEFKTPTGSFSQPFGDEIRRGTDVGVDYLARQSGSRCIKLTQIDINNSIANIDGHIRAASKQGIRFFVGLGTTDEALAAHRALGETGSILISPTASSNELLAERGRTILLYPTNADIAAGLAGAARRNKVERTLILYADNKRYSAHLAKVFEQEFSARGGTVVAAIGLRAGRINLEPHLDQIRSLSFTHVFVPLFELDAARAILSLRQSGFSPMFIASDSWGTYSRVIANLIRHQGVRALAPIIYDAKSTSPLNLYLVAEYQKRYARKPTDLGAFSFEAVMLIDAMARSCSAGLLADHLEECLKTVLPLESTTGTIKQSRGLALLRRLTVQESTLGMTDATTP